MIKALVAEAAGIGDDAHEAVLFVRSRINAGDAEGGVEDVAAMAAVRHAVVDDKLQDDFSGG